MRAYQALERVEAAFRNLQDLLELDSARQRTPERVRAGVPVVSLDLALDWVLQKQLNRTGLRLDTAVAREALQWAPEVYGQAGEGGTLPGQPEGVSGLSTLGGRPETQPLADPRDELVY